MKCVCKHFLKRVTQPSRVPKQPKQPNAAHRTKPSDRNIVLQYDILFIKRKTNLPFTLFTLLSLSYIAALICRSRSPHRFQTLNNLDSSASYWQYRTLCNTIDSDKFIQQRSSEFFITGRFMKSILQGIQALSRIYQQG